MIDGEAGAAIDTYAPAEQRRRAVVAAAFAEIARHGLEGLRLRGIAAVVGLDQSTLHYYFPTKNDLITHVVEYATARLRATLACDGSPAEQLRAHLRETARLIHEQPELFVVLGELSLRARRDPSVATIIERNDHGWRTFLATRLSAVTDRLEPEAGTDLVVAAIKGAAVDPGAAVVALAQIERLLLDETSDRKGRL